MVVPKKGTHALHARLCRVASFPVGSECELQESVTAVAGCACCERGCWFARAAFGFILGLRIRVGVSRRLREPACGVAFTGAGLWSTEPVEGVLVLLAAPFLLGAVLCSFLVVAALPSRLRCIAWLLCSGGVSQNCLLLS
ncbi:hypothetical protein Taro_028051 [Colocasia esculenta]|uniref:Uncharacterized protein n=1 Tax=Colocasia esculenta TaxID=4460 RepID=A0A843VJW7_COLES|nr:hypothetical protein [Colocasia esculenta]